MRITIVIIALAAIAVGMVHIRRARTNLRHEMQKLENEQIALKRQLQDQQIRMGRALAPSEIRRRTEEMSLQMVERVKTSNDLPGGRARPTGW